MGKTHTIHLILKTVAAIVTFYSESEPVVHFVGLLERRNGGFLMVDPARSTGTIFIPDELVEERFSGTVTLLRGSSGPATRNRWFEAPLVWIPVVGIACLFLGLRRLDRRKKRLPRAHRSTEALKGTASD